MAEVVTYSELVNWGEQSCSSMLRQETGALSFLSFWSVKYSLWMHCYPDYAAVNVGMAFKLPAAVSRVYWLFQLCVILVCCG